MVKLLIEAGASVTKRDVNGFSALDYAEYNLNGRRGYKHEASKIDETHAKDEAHPRDFAECHRLILAAEPRCEQCGGTAKECGVPRLRYCGVCRGVAYCCKEHQIADWPKHRLTCCGR